MEDRTSYRLEVESRVCRHCGLALPAGVDVCCGGMPLEENHEIEEIRQKYELLQIIGQGNTAVVYKARHRLMGNIVAVKLLRAKLETDDVYVKRLKRFHLEATALTRLDEESIVKVVDFGALSRGQAYIVMEYVEGQTLSQRLAESGRFPARQACQIGIRIARALAHAHSLNVVHRDLKPSNILLQGEDRIKLVDFGIARLLDEGLEPSRLTQTGEVFGSPAYMSPEQCQGLAQDGRSDVYALGCVMYEMLTGQPPFSGANPMQVMFQHAGTPPRPLREAEAAVDESLDRCVQKMLQKNPGDRQQSMEEVCADLESIDPLALPTSVRKNRSGRAKPQWRKRNLMVFGLVCGILVLVGVFFCFRSNSPGRVAFKEIFRDAGTHVGVPAEAFTDAVLAASIAHEKMPAVDLMNTAVTNKVVQTLLTVKDLRKLRLDYTKIDDDGIGMLVNHPTLEFIEMRGTHVTDNVFKHLAGLPKLQHFSLAGCKGITGRGLSSLAACKQLNDFSLRETALTDAGLKTLPPLPTLRKLHVDGTAVTDLSVPIILDRCPNLELIDIESTKITGAGLEQLAGAEHMKTILAAGCSGVVAAAEIGQRHPQCEIDGEKSER